MEEWMWISCDEKSSELRRKSDVHWGRREHNTYDDISDIKIHSVLRVRVKKEDR